MRRVVLTMMLLPLGIAATLDAAYLGLSTPPGAVPDPILPERQGTVTLEPSTLKYFEGDNVLILSAEMVSARGGAQHIVRLPGEVQWRRDMPNWCRHRRADVLTEIRRLSAGRRLIWLE